MIRNISLSVVLLFCTDYLFCQYQISASVFGNGGDSISGANYSLTSTLGQSFIENTQAPNYVIQSGFWYSANILTPVEKQDLIIKDYKLAQNYPNPFNPVTTIEYDLPEKSTISLTVYDIIGREVRILINEEKDMGNYKVIFSGDNLATGVYFYRMEAGSEVSDKQYTCVGKMILMK